MIILSLFSIGVHIGLDIFNYNRGSVTKYISQEYLTSDRHETDEAYRMFEGNLLHNESGVRVTYTSAEDYYGEHVDYKVIDLFILTGDNRKLAVEDVDFEKQVIRTPEGPLNFLATSKYIDAKEHAGPPMDNSAEADQSSFIDRIRNSPNRKFVAEALLAFLKSQNRRGSKAKKIELLEKFLAEIEEEEGRGCS